MFAPLFGVAIDKPAKAHGRRMLEINSFGLNRMTVQKAVADWLDIRPHEWKKLSYCILGAFSLMAFAIMARSVREGLYLTVFDVKALPYITAAVAGLSLPAVGLFVNFMGRRRPWAAQRALMIALGIGLAVLWAASLQFPAAVVVFYLWTALGTMLLTSGFWVMIAENFAVRGAKRLFGLIAAGGTAGAMVAGLSMGRVIRVVELNNLVPALLGILSLLFLFESLIQRTSGPASGMRYAIADDGGGGNKAGSDAAEEGRAKGRYAFCDNLRLIWDTPYLRLIVLTVFVATVSSNVVDYQFKEFAQEKAAGGEALTGFFGAFYGWAGGISLVVQLLFTSRIMSSAGVARSLAVLPTLLLLGSSSFLIIPGLGLATLVRGGDYMLRKSLMRPMLEFLYVPIAAEIRRRTKTFIDSFVDSAAEGTGAAAVFLWVVLLGEQSRYLSILVMALSLLMLALSRQMGHQYFNTIVNRLRQGGVGIGEPETHLVRQDAHLLTASYSRMDIQSMLERPTAGLEIGPSSESDAGKEIAPDENGTGSPGMPLGVAETTDARPDLQALSENDDPDKDNIPALTRLLARDNLWKAAADRLKRIGPAAVPHLAELLRNEEADFVIRRRIPAVLANIAGTESVKALLDSLSSRRFEVRYRIVVALAHLQNRNRKTTPEWETDIWTAIRRELECSRPVWEMRSLLDHMDSDADEGLVEQRVGVRGQLSLKHTFRMLSLVLDPEPVRAALHGIVLNNEHFKSFALEYLESVLPEDIRKGLWVFIGDLSEYRRARDVRPLKQVVSDLMSTRATLFRGLPERDALKKLLEEQNL